MYTLKYIKFHKDAKITAPKEGDAGYDLYALSYERNESGACYVVNTGIGVEIPSGYVGIIKDRSGQAFVSAETHAGVIDSSYRGEIKVLISIRNTNSEPAFMKYLGKFAQMVIVPYLSLPLEERNFLKETERGNKGFGSTGA